jgi:aarF domain-containing kinase
MHLGWGKRLFNVNFLSNYMLFIGIDVNMYVLFCTFIDLIVLFQTVQRKAKWLTKEKRESVWQNTHERNAKRLLNAILELEGLWVKLGQYLSTRADVLPEPYIISLKQLQDSLPPRPFEEVCVFMIC